MDTNTGAAPGAGGLSQAQESKLRSFGFTSDIIDDIRKANIPAQVLDKLDTISSPQQFATDIGMLWLPTGVTERIRSLGTASTPTMPATSAPATPPQGYATPAATPPISDYSAQPPAQDQQPPQSYAQVPSQGGYQQGGYAPPPQGYPQQQQGYPPQQGYPQQQGYPAQYQQGYPVAPPVKKSGVPAWVWIIGGVVLFFAICIIGFFVILGGAVKGLSGVVNVAGAAAFVTKFDTDLTAGNWQAAHNDLGGGLATRYSASTLQSKWQALMGTDNTAGVSGEIGQPRDSSDSTIIPWTITGANGKSYTIDMYVQKLSSSSDSLKIVDAKPDLIPSP
jgi:hypothetical protein